MPIYHMKTCQRCGDEKPFTSFNRDPQKKDGHYSYCKDCDGERKRALYREQRELVLKHYGGVCACCGEDRYEFLSIDHVNGGGNAHRRSLSDSDAAQLVRWLRRNGMPEGYRVLCMNCNHALGRYGYCPHEKSQLTH